MRIGLLRLAAVAALLTILPSGASAQVGTPYVLMDRTGVTSDTLGSSFYLSETTGRCIMRITATNNSGTNPTLDARVEHSPTATTGSHKTLESFTQQTTGGPTVEDVHINTLTTGVYPTVRAYADLGGSNPNYDIRIVLYCDKKK